MPAATDAGRQRPRTSLRQLCRPAGAGIGTHCPADACDRGRRAGSRAVASWRRADPSASTVRRESGSCRRSTPGWRTAMRWPSCRRSREAESMAFLSTTPIDLPALLARVESPTHGGIASFLGQVRDHHDGRTVRGLEYSAYGPMAEMECAAIVAEAEARWPVRVALAASGGRPRDRRRRGGRRRRAARTATRRSRPVGS